MIEIDHFFISQEVAFFYFVFASGFNSRKTFPLYCPHTCPLLEQLLYLATATLVKDLGGVKAAPWGEVDIPWKILCTFAFGEAVHAREGASQQRSDCLNFITFLAFSHRIRK